MTKVICNVCGTKLTVYEFKDDELEVEPCVKCIEDEYYTGYLNGDANGHGRGYRDAEYDLHRAFSIPENYPL